MPPTIAPKPLPDTPTTPGVQPLVTAQPSALPVATPERRADEPAATLTLGGQPRATTVSEDTGPRLERPTRTPAQISATANVDPLRDPKRLAAAFDAAYGKTAQFITDRSDVSYRYVLGSTMDETYWARIGNLGTDGYGFNPQQLAEASTRLFGQGLPRPEQSEVDATNLTMFYGRSRGTPMQIVKHFPGGDMSLELTETREVHFGDTQKIEHWVAKFQAVFNSASPPAGVMLSHATYSQAAFPGIERFEAERHASDANVRDVPFDSLPASLNPSLIRYVRETMGFKGLIVPDWYDMDSIAKFASHLPREFPHAEPLPGEAPFDADEKSKLDTSVRNFILGVEAGVNFIPTVQPYVASQPLWQTYIKDHPDFGQKLDAVIADTYSRIRKPGDPAVDITKLTTEQKILLLVHNPQHHDNDWAYEPGQRSTDTNTRNAFSLFMRDGLGDYDVWNRSGLTTLLTRQFVVEEIAGRPFGPPPTKIADEAAWFTRLMSNKAFRAIYDRIDWASPQIQALRAQAVQRVTGLSIPAASSLSPPES